MRVSRTPLRVTLGGGGTDLVNGEGFCVAAAIDKYITIAVNDPFTDDYILRYSQTERVKSLEEIQHNLIRSVFTTLDVQPGIEVSSTADIPSGTGLGTSGAFAVGLIRVLNPTFSHIEVARLASLLDTGQQDQYAATFGGVHAFDFKEKTLRPVSTTIDEHLQLFYTGGQRESAPVAVNFPRARLQAEYAIKALEQNDPELLGVCLLEQWNAKHDAQPTPFHASMDRVIQGAMKHGAYGGKLIGAGNGGFLLFAGKVDPLLMRRQGLVEVPFKFEYDGSVIL